MYNVLDRVYVFHLRFGIRSFDTYYEALAFAFLSTTRIYFIQSKFIISFLSFFTEFFTHCRLKKNLSHPRLRSNVSDAK